MLTYDLKWPWRGHKSKLVIFWPKRDWDMIILKVIAQWGQNRWTYLTLLDFCIVFQWRGHDLISDLRSLHKKILDMHIIIVRRLQITSLADEKSNKTSILAYVHQVQLSLTTSLLPTPRNTPQIMRSSSYQSPRVKNPAEFVWGSLYQQVLS